MNDINIEIERLNQQMAQHPETADQCCNRIGELLGAQGQYGKALAYFHRAIQMNPMETTYHYNLGLALHNLGEEQDALKCYNQALMIRPTISAYNNRACLYNNMKQYAEAVEDCTAALNMAKKAKDDSSKTLIYATRAEAYMGMEEYGKAHTDLMAGMKLDPDEELIGFYDKAIIKCNIKLGKSCKEIYS